ncbi:hypothetical protein PENTCL1PPCAC_15664 [Pristionchus entomophagus]|uniref:G protein-coupled receptor n=1 Tax=Pristionchus entomophagus TaxID=358040 RepID=A0AAV5TGJ9_9BILA|nr:hypothetical protein PENTCL1PPCAC_15664 [Pristionchus entomophagus]
MLTTTDTVHTVALCSLDISAIALNALLVYAIVTRLINLHDGSQLYVFVGACSHLGRWFCHLCQTIHLFFVCHSTVVLLHSFCFRLYILRENITEVKIPTSLVTFLICVLLYGPTLLMMVFFYSAFEYTPPELMRALHFEDYPTTWYPNITDHRFVIALSFVVILSPSAMVMMFFVRRRLLGAISKMK